MKTSVEAKSKTRLLIVYPFITLAVLIALNVSFNSYTRSVISQKSTDVINYQGQHSADIIGNDINHMLGICYQMITDLDFTNQVKDMYNGASSPDFSTLPIANSFARYLEMDTNLAVFTFISASDYSFVKRDKSYQSYNLGEWGDENRRREVADSIIEEGAFVFFLPTEDSLNTYLDIAFYIGFPIKRYTSGTVYGVVLMGVRESFFDTFGPHNQFLPELLRDAHSLVVDRSGTIVHDADEAWSGVDLTRYFEENKINEADYIITIHDINRSTWQFYTISPRNIVFQALSVARVLEWLLIIVTAALFLLAVFSVLKLQSKRISEISTGILAYSDKVGANAKIPLSDFTELNEIINQFNKMTDRINSLIERLQDEKRTTAEALNRQRKAELRTLEAQINPHFLYNTLDTINWMALENDEYEISNMLGVMASLLRYSIANIDGPVLLCAEIEWLKKYLFLQDKRFKGLFTYTIEVEPPLGDCVIQKMLLQPLVENSILHAFSDRTSGGEIRITIRHAEPDRMRILIEDNGSGISPERLEQLRRLIRTREYSGENIGFYNVIGRLTAYYGDKGKLEINSGAWGTAIAMSLPVIYHTREESGYI